MCERSWRELSPWKRNTCAPTGATERWTSLGRLWLRDGALPPEQASRLLTLLVQLRDLYRHHIATEDNEVFPGRRGGLLRLRPSGDRKRNGVPALDLPRTVTQVLRRHQELNPGSAARALERPATGQSPVARRRRSSE